MRTFSISFPDDAVNRLDRAAENEHRSRSNFLLVAFEEYLHRTATEAENGPEHAASEAAAAHLAEHRRLTGLPTEDDHGF